MLRAISQTRPLSSEFYTRSTHPAELKDHKPPEHNLIQYCSQVILLIASNIFFLMLIEAKQKTFKRLLAVVSSSQEVMCVCEAECVCSTW